MTNFIMIGLSIIPSLILLRYVYFKDKVEKEPHYLLLILFVAGIVSAVITVFINIVLKINIPFLNDNYTNLNLHQLVFKFFVTIALVEEVIKWIINYVITWKNKNFNHIYDSIVYATFVALGFATYENVLYGFAYFSHGLMPMLLRGLISIPCHCVFGIYSGFYLGIAKNSVLCCKEKQALKYKVKSLIVPIIIHFIYDLLLAKDFYYLFTIYVVILYSLAYLKIKKLSSVNKMLV